MAPSKTTSLKKIATVTGVPFMILEKVRERGYAAWRSGHRAGSTPTQWANARLSSFLTRGCTSFSGDFDLMESLLRKKYKSKKLLSFLKGDFNCPKYKLQSFQKKNSSIKKYLSDDLTHFIFST